MITSFFLAPFLDFDEHLGNLHHRLDQLQFARIPLKHSHVFGDVSTGLLTDTD